MAPSIAAALIVTAPAARAQHASDNPVTSAQDAYGLTLGLESVGMYSPGLVRGFSPQTAGNIRIDGIYFDQQGGLSERVVEGSTIRVGVSEIGYPFPAPTGIADFDLRHPGGDTPSATVITSVGPYDAWGVSIDGSLPVIDKQLVVPMGVSYQVSTSSQFGPYPNLTSQFTSVGAAPAWTPNDAVTVRALFDWQETRDARTFPLYFTAGDFLPPRISNGYLGQNWALGRNETLNLGALVDARLTDVWSLKAGIFQSKNDNPSGFADLYTNVQPDGQSDHVVVGYPDQVTTSNSGEVRLTGTFTTGAWQQHLIFMARGRDTTARFGGEDAVDLGAAVIGTGIQVPKPDFMYSARTVDHTDLWSVGAAYHVDWRNRATFEAGVQGESYHEAATSPGKSPSRTAAHPLRAYANSAFAVNPFLTVYAGYTEGLENSGVAPNFAQNSGAVLPASLTWQLDAGARVAVTPKLNVIAGVYELQKPYFNLDRNNVDRELGEQRARGIELSIAGELLPHFDVNIGVLADKVGITGPDLAAEGVGPIAVGQPRLTYVANANYELPWWPAASLDVSVTHFGREPESVDNRIYTPEVTQVNLGGRYKFTAFGQNNTVRLQIQNAFNSVWWTNFYTPGFFEWPGPRTVFAYLTTDLQE